MKLSILIFVLIFYKNNYLTFIIDIIGSVEQKSRFLST